MLSGDNGILKKAAATKEQTGIGQEKEIVTLAYNSALAKKVGNGDSTEVTAGDLNAELTNQGATAAGSNPIKVTFTASKRQYTLGTNGEITLVEITKVTNINLSESSKEVNEQEEFTIVATANGSEDLAFTWTKTSGDINSNLTITTEKSTDGLTTIAKITANATGTGTITVSAPNATAQTCTITIVSPFIDYSYVEYDVEYTDVDTGNVFTKNTGWRLLTPDSKLGENAATEGAEATYTGDVEIISTGLPAKLLYYFPTVNNYESDGETEGKWAGNNAQKTTYVTEYYGTETNTNVCASAGLLYNFRNIVYSVTGTTETLYTGAGNAFESNDTRNHGGFISIKNSGITVNASSSTTGTDLFEVSSLKSGSVSGIRDVTLEDIKDIKIVTSENLSTAKATIKTKKDKRLGLFNLYSYTPDVHTNGIYWLASPSFESQNHVYSVTAYRYNIREPWLLRRLCPPSNFFIRSKTKKRIWKSCLEDNRIN